jgi:hypothetical protein
VDGFVTTEVESTPLVERISREVYHLIGADAQEMLRPFVTEDGRVEAPFDVDVLVTQWP